MKRLIHESARMNTNQKEENKSKPVSSNSFLPLIRVHSCEFVDKILLLFLLFPFFVALPAKAEEITVSAAISLKESLTQIGSAYEKAAGDRIIFNFDASGKLAAQIQLGAPVDAFISADDEQMNKLTKAGKIAAGTRRVIVDNSLVLIVPAAENNVPRSFTDLAIDNGKKIAVGEPKTVPAGHYALQTLKALKLDTAVASRLVFGESVRQVLTYVEQNEVCAGIVYATDAKQAGDKVKLIATADPATHEVIEYPAAVVAASARKARAQQFLDFLATDTAKTIFTDRGFGLPPASAAEPTTRPSP
jgi:molybdate transport system substrate-binding protein